MFDLLFVAVTQDIRHQEEIGEEDEAKQAHPLLDPYEDRQYHQVFFLFHYFFPFLLILFIFWFFCCFALSGTMLSVVTGAVQSLDSEVLALLRFVLY